MTSLLLMISLLLTAVVVLVLVGYLVGIIVALAQTGGSLSRLTGSLAAVRKHSLILPEHLQSINRDLFTLLQPLSAVDRNLEAIVAVAQAVQSRSNRPAGAA
jgi:hypothetical protein